MTRANPFIENAADRNRATRISLFLEAIVEWYDEHLPEHFDPQFVYDLQEQFEEKGDLSDNQIAALERIYDRWCTK